MVEEQILQILTNISTEDGKVPNDYSKATQPLQDLNVIYTELITKTSMEEFQKGYNRSKNLIELGRKEISANKAIEISKGEELFGIDPQVRDYIKNQSFLASQSVMNRVNENINNNLAKSYENGIGIKDASKSLQKEFTSLKGYEATRIARTEINSAQNLGSFASYSDYDIEYHQWWTGRDSRVRYSHRKLHGEITSVGSSFTNGLLYPGDRAGRIREWIHCRCTTVPFIPHIDKITPPWMERFHESDLVDRPSPVQHFREFKEKHEFYNYAEKNLKHDKGLWKGNTLNKEGKQLEIYKDRKNNWHSIANTALRTLNVEQIPKTLKSEIRLLDAALKNKSIDEDIIVYRYLESFKELRTLEKNNAFPELGYMSTSSSLDYVSRLWYKNGKKGYILRIHVPKGTNGIQVETALRRKVSEDEGEFLIRRESNLLIKNVDHNKEWIECMLIQ